MNLLQIQYFGLEISCEHVLGYNLPYHIKSSQTSPSYINHSCIRHNSTTFALFHSNNLKLFGYKHSAIKRKNTSNFKNNWSIISKYIESCVWKGMDLVYCYFSLPSHSLNIWWILISPVGCCVGCACKPLKYCLVKHKTFTPRET